MVERAGGSVTAAKRVRVGVLGLGAVAQSVHLPLLARRSDLFEVGAIADASRSTVDAVGDRFAIPTASRHVSLEAMLAAGGLDGLLVLTTGSHAPASLAALDAGLAVLCEKPLAFTLAEADGLAAHPSAARLLLGYMKQYDPAVRRAASILRDASLRIRSIEVTVLHPTGSSQMARARLLPPSGDIPPEQVAAWSEETRRLRAVALGDAAAAEIGAIYSELILGSLIHELSVVRSLAGEVGRVDGADWWAADVAPGSVAFSGRLAGGTGGARVAMQWHYLPDFPAYREEVRVHHERGFVSLVFPSPYWLHAPTRMVSTSLDGGAEVVERFRSTDEAFEAELEAFHALATRGERPLAGVAEGRADIVTCQRIAARLAQGRGMPVAGEAGTS